MTVERVVELEHWEFPARAMFPGVSAALWPHDTVDRLAGIVPPEQVDVVVCTHLHPDHGGGLTRLVDGRWVPSFPNARHLVPAGELAWLQALSAQSWPDDRPEADLARTYLDSVAPVVDAGLVDVVEVPVVVAPGVTVSPAPGHTAGHVVVEIEVGEAYAVVSGDVIHSPFQLGDLDLPHVGDADPGRAGRTRHELIDRLVARDGLLLPAHFPPGRVVKDPAGPRTFVPV